jgi:hypothetical protein
LYALGDFCTHSGIELDYWDSGVSRVYRALSFGKGLPYLL